MRVYYNENDPAAAMWLCNLIQAGLIPAGDVDQRSIEDVRPSDLAEYQQCHFFAGIGGWAYALSLAEWDNSQPVWTGSCPCQPFSAAGKGDGFADERHLWPAWFHLISQCRPERIFGEQVAGAANHGWLDIVQSELEGQGYRVGAAVLGAHSVGAPHIRQRLWFVADTNGNRRTQVRSSIAKTGSDGLVGNGSAGSVSNSMRIGQQGQGGVVRSGDSEEVGDWQEHRTVDAGRSHWSSAIQVPCADGKARIIEPGLEPLAHGLSGRVVRLRGYGNAIVPQTAAAFIKAYMSL